ncbi:MAG: hypothetical protein R3A44_17600 [Caldilineaceae bacterium]
MPKEIPLVSSGRLCDPQLPGSSIQLDTQPGSPGWRPQPPVSPMRSSIAPAAATLMVSMTVRKERRQRGSAYWSVYRRHGQRLRKIYVGPSAALTAIHLERIAARLYDSHSSHAVQPRPDCA